MHFHLRREGEHGLAVGRHRHEVSLEQEVHRALPALHREVATHGAEAMADCPRIVGQRGVLANDRRAVVAGAAEARSAHTRRQQRRAPGQKLPAADR